MTFQQELASWNPFASDHQISSVPEVGKPAPSLSKLQISRNDERPVVLAFLRHCGCPFAEKQFKRLRNAAEIRLDTRFLAISHSDQNATSNWLQGVGGSGRIEVVVDSKREIYGAYGLGYSSFWHALNPWSMASMIKLGRSEQIWNRPTESGSRWQTAGLFSINADGLIRYVHVADAADDLGDLEEALASVKQ